MRAASPFLSGSGKRCETMLLFATMFLEGNSSYEIARRFTKNGTGGKVKIGAPSELEFVGCQA